MRRRRSPSPHQERIIELVINEHGEFKKKYTVIDDLVNYVVGNPNLRVMYDNTPVFISGFTPDIGRLVVHMHRQCRANGPFMNEVQFVLDNCRDGPEYRTAYTFAQDIISNYAMIIEGESFIFYFAFFAVICELCSRFMDNGEYFTAIKNIAKATLSAYWDDTLKCDELDEFARNNLHCSEEVFAEHFRGVLHFLYNFELSDDDEEEEEAIGAGGEEEEAVGTGGEEEEAVGAGGEEEEEEEEEMEENGSVGEEEVEEEEEEEGVAAKRRRRRS